MKLQLHNKARQSVGAKKAGGRYPEMLIPPPTRAEDDDYMTRIAEYARNIRSPRYLIASIVTFSLLVSRMVLWVTES